MKIEFTDCPICTDQMSKTFSPLTPDPIDYCSSCGLSFCGDAVSMDSVAEKDLLKKVQNYVASKHGLKIVQ